MIEHININKALAVLNNKYRKKQAAVFNDGYINLTGRPISETQLRQLERNKAELDKYAPYAPKNKTIFVPQTNFFSGMHLGNLNFFVSPYNEDEQILAPSNSGNISRKDEFKGTMDHEQGHNATGFNPFMQGLRDYAPAPKTRHGAILTYNTEQPSVAQELASYVIDNNNLNKHMGSGYETFSTNPYMYFLGANDTGPFGLKQGPLTRDEFIDYTLPRVPGERESGWGRVKRYLKRMLPGMAAGAVSGAALFGGASYLRNKKSPNMRRLVLSSLLGAGLGAAGGLAGGWFKGYAAKQDPYISPAGIKAAPANAVSVPDPEFPSDIADKVKMPPLQAISRSTRNIDPRLAKLENWVNSGMDAGYTEFERRKSLANTARRGMNIVKNEHGVYEPTPQAIMQALSQQRDPNTREQYFNLKSKVLDRLKQYTANPRYLNVMKKWKLSPEGESFNGVNKFALTMEQMQEVLRDFEDEDRYSDMDNSSLVNGATPYSVLS